MPLNKAQGNMYDWVDFTHSHLAGKCPHECKYCYVQTGKSKGSSKYQGPVRLLEHELRVPYGNPGVYFIEHMNDLFANGVPDEWITKIFLHCRAFPANEYVFQTKNPERFRSWSFGQLKCIVGTTIETNREMGGISKAPPPWERFRGIKEIRRDGMSTFITIEPIMDFDLDRFVEQIVDAAPEFVNIGADSKGCSLPEPSPEKVQALVAALNENKIVIRKKHNLGRMLGNA